MKILPKPNKIDRISGITQFSSGTEILSPISVIPQELNFLDYEKGAANRVEFSIGETEFDYELTIDGNIKAVSKSEAGLFHAAMTLKQLVFEGYTDGISTLENCKICDKPRFEYRGFMLDIVRHFFGKDVILKLIDVLALAKFSVFHLHLSDNQGYRLESTAFPVLNEKAHLRKQTRGDGMPVGGYLTKKDVAEIVAYAAERYIEIIPEIDLPGHTVALLAAMPEMGCTGEEYELAERFGIDSRIICAGDEKNYQILAKLLAEVAEMFPCRYFHMGGDEVPKFQWQSCKRCQSMVKKEGLKDFEQLQGYFTNRMIKTLKTLDKVPIVWNEALYSGMLDEGAVCQYWQDGKRAERVVAAADKGRKIIFSKFRPFYLDYPYGMSSLKAVYDTEPTAFFDDAAKKNVIGVETPLWTEYVADLDRLYYQAFPRAFAVAESGWADEKKDYADFVERLYNVLGILQAYEVGFASVRESNPNPIKGACKVIKFFANALDVDALRSAKNANDAKKGRERE